MTTRTRARAAVTAAIMAFGAALVPVAVASAPTPAAPAAAPPVVPAGFQDTLAIGNLTGVTSFDFAPDGTAFVALQTGVIKSHDYDPVTDTFDVQDDATEFATLLEPVNHYWDRGLTGIAVDPRFGQPGHNYVYVNYTLNRDPRSPGTVPAWGPEVEQYDQCPSPAAMPSGTQPAVAGCVVELRVSRLPAVRQAQGWVMSGAEEPLLDLPLGQTACFQFGSHTSGDLAFGPDGMLYASAGDGASFDTEDWGQAGNPCGDPVDEGGALRAQDYRSSGDPLGLGGTVFRIDPDGGRVAQGAQANASRIVAYGQRNPWRLTFRPGTSELWSVDVGASAWEEVNRLNMASFSGPVNRGWPCYEGGSRQAGWDALDKPLCESLYTQGAGAVAAPYFSYRTRGAGLLTPGEKCEEGTSSISGVAFISTAAGTGPGQTSYPEAYRGAMFFNDFARGCIWRLGKKQDGNPDPATIVPFVQRAESPTSIKVGPGGDLYYGDYGIVEGQIVGGAGGIHRIRYTPANQAPVAKVTASAPYGVGLLSVDLDASGSSDADGDPLTYDWDLDGDGSYEVTNGGATRTQTYASGGPRTVRVRVSDGEATDVAQVLVTPGNTAPTIQSMSPPSSFTWSVGQAVPFAATATDAQQTLPDNAFRWSLVIEHCPSVCHTHPLTSFTGRTGSFPAPDHEYPSRLLLTLTVTDAQGLTDTESVTLLPTSVAMTFASDPPGAPLTVAGAGVMAPHPQTFIQGSTFNVSAPATRSYQGRDYVFSSWSDGGERTHSVTAPTAPTTLTARYAVVPPTTLVPTPRARFRVDTRPGKLKVKVDGKPRRDDWRRSFDVGTRLRVSAPKVQWRRGVRYVFKRWSDGGNRTHRVTVPATGLRLKAVYRRTR